MIAQPPTLFPSTQMSTDRITLSAFAAACRSQKVPMSRATFYRTLRRNDSFLESIDARENSLGINFDAAKTADWIAQRVSERNMDDPGTPLSGRSALAERFFRLCPNCGEDVHARLSVCGSCGAADPRSAA